MNDDTQQVLSALSVINYLWVHLISAPTLDYFAREGVFLQVVHVIVFS